MHWEGTDTHTDKKSDELIAVKKFSSCLFQLTRAPQVGGLPELASVLSCRMSHPGEAQVQTPSRQLLPGIGFPLESSFRI